MGYFVPIDPDFAITIENRDENEVRVGINDVPGQIAIIRENRPDINAIFNRFAASLNINRNEIDNLYQKKLKRHLYKYSGLTIITMLMAFIISKVDASYNYKLYNSVERLVNIHLFVFMFGILFYVIIYMIRPIHEKFFRVIHMLIKVIFFLNLLLLILQFLNLVYSMTNTLPEDSLGNNHN
ncbi:hypothetical protein BDAP_000062 [Binucleata daphniae]